MKRNPIEWVCELLLDVTMIPILAMMVHVTLDVVLKYTLNSPIQGTLEIVSIYYMVAIVVLPIGFIELGRSAIAVDLFFDRMPRGMQLYAVALTLILNVIAYGALAANTLPTAIRSLQRHELVAGPVTMVVWPARFLMPLAFSAAALICIVHLIRFTFNSQVRNEFVRPSTPSIEVD